MDKEYIELLLKDEETINIVSKERLCVSVNMNIHNFFNVLFAALAELHIRGYAQILRLPDSLSSMELQDIHGLENIFYFDAAKLQNKIDTYNIEKCDMSFRESAEALIDIFLNLLG